MPWKNFLQKLKKQGHCKRRQVDIKPYQNDSNCVWKFFREYTWYIGKKCLSKCSSNLIDYGKT